MSEVQLDPYVLHQFDAEPVYVEDSRVDQVFVQDNGLEFPPAERYDVDRQSQLTYEATVELTGLDPTTPILCDAAYLAYLFEHSEDQLSQLANHSFYLDDRLVVIDIGSRVIVPVSGEVAQPPYVTPDDGSGQVRNEFSFHPALEPEDPDFQYQNLEFPYFLGPYFVLDGADHPNHPYYFYIYPPLPTTFTVRVTVIMILPREVRGSFPTDVGPFDGGGGFGYQYPAGDDSYGPASTEADTTYAMTSRIEWPKARLDVYQFGNFIPPGEVIAGPRRSGVVRSRRVPGKRMTAENPIAAVASSITVSDGITSGVLGETGVLGAAPHRNGVTPRNP